MRFPVSNFYLRRFGTGVALRNYRIALTAVLSECVLQVLELEMFLFFLFMGMTVAIEPATSRFIISRPAVGAIVEE